MRSSFWNPMPLAALLLTLSLSHTALATVEQAQEAQKSAKAMADEAGRVSSASAELKKLEDAWKTKADAWKGKADAWLATEKDANKSDTDKTNAKKAAEKAKGEADEARAAYEKAKKAGGDKSVIGYATENVSLTAGAVVLNPFKLESVDTDMDPDTVEYRLQTGDTDVNVLLEAGFRLRWAWETAWSSDAMRLSREIRGLNTQIDVEQRKTPDGERMLDGSQKTALDNSLEDIKKWKKEIQEKRGELRDMALDFEGDLSEDFHAAGWRGEGDAPFWKDAIAFLLLPDNYLVRLGFALGSEQPSGAAAVAGAGDFYIETALGWDWLRIQQQRHNGMLKMAFGPEAYASFSNDSDLDDFHQRVLLGGAFTLGIPFWRNVEDQHRLAEMVVRFGYVEVEIPDFLDSTTRLVRVENELPDFKDEGGFGVDVEMNIPITGDRGYIFLRATSNHGFDPNPWTTTLGYTIPIQDLVGILNPD